jgi:hypothetical protein
MVLPLLEVLIVVWPPPLVMCRLLESHMLLPLLMGDMFSLFADYFSFERGVKLLVVKRLK